MLTCWQIASFSGSFQVITRFHCNHQQQRMVSIYNVMSETFGDYAVLPIRLQTLAGAQGAIACLVEAGGGSMTVQNAAPGDMEKVVKLAEGARERGLLLAVRESLSGLTLELAPAGSLARGRRPGPLSERLRAMAVGDAILLPSAEHSIGAIRTMVSRINADTPNRLLVVYQAGLAQINHRVEARPIKTAGLPQPPGPSALEANGTPDDLDDEFF